MHTQEYIKAKNRRAKGKDWYVWEGKWKNLYSKRDYKIKTHMKTCREYLQRRKVRSKQINNILNSNKKDCNPEKGSHHMGEDTCHVLISKELIFRKVHNVKEQSIRKMGKRCAQVLHKGQSQMTNYKWKNVLQ